MSLTRLPAASQSFAPVEAGNVFASYEPLRVELEAPLNEIFKQRAVGFPKFKEISVDGNLAYWNEQNQKVMIPVSVHVKGFSSVDLCEFPKLELKMKNPAREGTLFSSTKTVDLNTHCVDSKVPANFSEDIVKAFRFNHREALLYRMAETLGIPTFKARPVFINYRKTGIDSIDQKTTPYQAFFLEDAAAFAKRLHGQEIKGINDPLKGLTLAMSPEKKDMYQFTDLQTSAKVDLEDASRIALFQAMIANSDWFIKPSPNAQRFGSDSTNLWNTKILALPTGRWVLFPQDFNFAGITFGGATSEAQVNKDIYNVVDRPAQERLKQVFIAKKEDVYKLLNTLTQDPEGPAKMKQTLDSFYSLLEKSL